MVSRRGVRPLFLLWRTSSAKGSCHGVRGHLKIITQRPSELAYTNEIINPDTVNIGISMKIYFSILLVHGLICKKSLHCISAT